MVNETTILAAIADLKTQTKLNYDAMAKKYNVDCNKLQKHFKDKIISVAEAHFENLKFFNNVEKQIFVDWFNILSVWSIFFMFKLLANIV